MERNNMFCYSPEITEEEQLELIRKMTYQERFDALMLIISISYILKIANNGRINKTRIGSF